MNENDIKKSFKNIEPSDAQKSRMLNNIEDSLCKESNDMTVKMGRNKSKWYYKKSLYTKVACFVCFVLIFSLSFQSLNFYNKNKEDLKNTNEANRTTIPPFVDNNINSEKLVKDSYEDIFEFLSSSVEYKWKSDLENENGSSNNSNDSIDLNRPGSNESSSGSNSSPDESTGNTTPDYSDTNLQVVGVQEADVIKTDGKYIYAISNEYLYIVSAKDGSLNLASKIKRGIDDSDYTENKIFYEYKGKQSNLFEMYVTQNRLIVLNYFYEQHNRYYFNENHINDLIDYNINKYKYGVIAEIYDITDRTDPKHINSLGQSGYYISSRMIGDTLYLVTNYYMDRYGWGLIDKTMPETYIPQLYINATTNLVNPRDIYINPETDGNFNQYLIINGIDTSGEGKIVSTKSLLGYGSNIYASLENLYVQSHSYVNDGDYQINSTKLFKFSIDKGIIRLMAEGSVPGHILNQFSMDEYDGVFRIVTTVNSYKIINNSNGDNGIMRPDIGWWGIENHKEYNCLYTLNDNLEIIGKIEELAPDERVYSVRFDGDLAYFVTFRQVDPLFAVDLTNPKNPTVLSELKIPGFSEYLHKFTDGLLFGLGKDADEETGMVGYMKLSMFDIADSKNVTEKHTLIINGKRYSEASYNHKAILIDAKKNIIAFPCDDTYLVYSYDEDTGFNREARIKMNNNLGYYYNYGNMRGLFIGDYLYVVTNNNILSYSMNDYEFASSLRLR